MSVLKNNQDESAFYKAQIDEVTEQVNDMEQQFLEENTTYDDSEVSTDLWQKYLNEQGAITSPSTIDKWADFLRQQGYLTATGNLQDAQIQYFKDNS